MPSVWTARADNRRFGLLNALRAHTEEPYKNDVLWRTLGPLKRPGLARTEQAGVGAARGAEELRGEVAEPVEVPRAVGQHLRRASS